MPMALSVPILLTGPPALVLRLGSAIFCQGHGKGLQEFVVRLAYYVLGGERLQGVTFSALIIAVNECRTLLRALDLCFLVGT